MVDRKIRKGDIVTTSFQGFISRRDVFEIQKVSIEKDEVLDGKGKWHPKSLLRHATVEDIENSLVNNKVDLQVILEKIQKLKSFKQAIKKEL